MYLEIRDIKKMFDKTRGLKEINLNIKKGDLVSFLGPSGCGKTTLLNILGGFIKPESGNIILEGKDITDLSPEKRDISTVFQNYALFPHMNVIENIGYGLKYKKISKKQRKELCLEYLKIVDLEGYENYPIAELSGGQQQRVALARALILKPKILLLDEPFSNLDAKLKISMREELKKLQKKLQITMIFVTHDQEEALSISDQVVVMEVGAIVQTGTPQDIYYNPINNYVANFIGKSNFMTIDGAIKIIKSEDIEMEVDRSGTWEITSKEFMGTITLFKIERNEEKLYVSCFGKKSNMFKISDKVKIKIL